MFCGAPRRPKPRVPEMSQSCFLGGTRLVLIGKIVPLRLKKHHVCRMPINLIQDQW